MRRALCLALSLAVMLPAAIEAQSSRRRTTTTRKAPATKREPAKVVCPATLGTGVETKRVFCDVLAGRDPAEGVLVTIPAHSGTATLTFDLHNRHTYSESQVKAGEAYAEYTATIGVLTMKNDLLSRAVVYSSFRTAADLLDRVGGGAGPGGVKAVAPTGTEPIVIKIPQDVTQVSLLGERLVTRRVTGEEVATSSGRPIAIVSNVMVEYRPAPARRTTTRRR
ncbi:MAG: hypothetical protein MUF60_00290 [Vicinamibacterales bacterium]|nr:hypothetical protein [Vicinamibacterales bacterium]